MKKILPFLIFILAFSVRAQNYTNWPPYVAPVASAYSANLLLQSTDAPSFQANSGIKSAITNNAIAATNGTGVGTTIINGGSVAVSALSVTGNTWLNNSNLLISHVTTTGEGGANAIISIWVTNNNHSETWGMYYYTNDRSGTPKFFTIPANGFIVQSAQTYPVSAINYNVGDNYGGAINVVYYGTTNSSPPTPGATYTPTWYNAKFAPVGTFTFYGAYSSSTNVISNFTNSLLINSTNGTYFTGNVDSTIGFTINGQPIRSTSGGVSDSGLSFLASTNLIVSGASGMATNFNGTFIDTGLGYYINGSGVVLIKKGAFVSSMSAYTLCTNYFTFTNGYAAPSYYSYSLTGNYLPLAGSPTNQPLVSYTSQALQSLTNGLASTNDLSIWSFNQTNGVLIDIISTTNGSKVSSDITIHGVDTNAVGALITTATAGMVTNFTLSGYVEGFTTSNSFSASGSNSIINLIAQYGVNPTNGISTATATNIAANLIATATNSLWSSATNTFYLNSNPSNFTTFQIVTNLIQQATNGLAGGGGTSAQVFFTATNPFAITAQAAAIAFNTNGCLWINRSGASNNWLNIITNN